MAGERRSDKDRRSGPGSFSMAPPQIDVFWLAVYLALIVGCVAVMTASPAMRPHAFIGLIVTLAMMSSGWSRPRSREVWMP